METPRNDGTTPAMMAAHKGHTKVLEVLERPPPPPPPPPAVAKEETEEEAAEREEQLLNAFEGLEVHTRQTLHARAEFKSTR